MKKLIETVVDGLHKRVDEWLENNEPRVNGPDPQPLPYFDGHVAGRYSLGPYQARGRFVQYSGNRDNDPTNTLLRQSSQLAQQVVSNQRQIEQQLDQIIEHETAELQLVRTPSKPAPSKKSK